MEILGIDIGGTGIKGAIVDVRTGELLCDRERLETPQPATPDAVVSTVKDLVDKFQWKGLIGCGFPAAVRHDVIMTASNISKSWIGLNASEKIEQATKCRTHLVNDVDAAGYAEMHFGAGKGNLDSVIMIAVGTGIGTALFTEGVLYPNTELGFIKIKGMAGEHYASNTVRVRDELDWHDWGKRLNRYLRRIEKLFFPDLIILGGGVSKKFEKFEEFFKLKTPIVPAQLLNNAGIVGAALAAHHHFIETHH